ncbi:hypothetical protein CY34DRAFT_812775 [Suillus luteus UH-Slu-Lm8-n1]|uniref:Uncharacterized protein n=1 Tax=Suillus luteus UH-Slu-Lm8-n1 TaxID=930992 RepID=A0A0D0A945_9AGAM|nr:hypothetical protein CY34DRAFT_812775 [Suillus luteus UH-Slu-Lm8-n1]
MFMNACTSQFAPLEDVVMGEAELFSLPELLDNNSLKPLEVQNVSIQMCEDHSAEFSQQSIETPRKAVFSQASSDASPSQYSQPFKSLSNQDLSHHPSLSLSQSQHSDSFRRKRRRLEELTIDVPKAGNTGTIQASSLVSALVRRKTEESIDVPPYAARSHYRSLRVPSPDSFLDATSELMTSPHEHEQHPSAITPGNLAPSQSVPLIVSPQPERSSSLRGHKRLANSSTSVLVTPTSSRAIGSAPIPLVLGNTLTTSIASSSKIPRPSFVNSEKSSNSRSVERRKRREIAEKLCLARPDLVDPSYAAKRARRSSRFKDLPVSAMQDMSSSTIGSSPSHLIAAQTSGPSLTMIHREFRPASRFSTSEQVASTAVRNRPAKRCRELLDEDTEDVCQTMDWERSRRLARDVTGALAAGREAKDVLPQLMCLSAPRRHPAG